MKTSAALFVFLISPLLVAQEICPAVVFQGPAYVPMADTQSNNASYSGLMRQADGSFTALRYSGSPPYRLLGRTPNFDQAFYSCFGYGARRRGTATPSVLSADRPGASASVATFAALGTNGSQLAILGADSRFFRTGIVVGYVNPDMSPRNQVNVEIGANPAAVLSADFDNDRLADAVGFVNGANFSAAVVAFLKGNADGSFAAPVPINLGGAFLGATAGDLNKDSRLDLIVATQITSPLAYRLHILLGSSTGAFTVRTQTIASTCAAPVTGDFNRDGNVDIVCSDSDRNLNVFAGNGDGTLRAPQTVSIGLAAREMLPADLNGDGNLDVAIAGRTGEGIVAALLGNGALGFPTQHRYSGLYDSEGLVISDFDSDGKLDLVQAVGGPHGLSFQRGSLLVAVNFGRGDGTFEGAPAFRLPASGNADPLIADFDGDSRQDLAFLAANGTFHLYRGQSNGSFAAIDSSSPLTGQVSGVVAVEVADLNGDTRPDLALVDSRQGLYVALNNGSGRFSNITRVDSASDLVHVSAGDVNGDGRPDLVVANNGGSSNSAAGNVSIYLNSGAGGFTKSATLTPGAKPVRAYVQDLNGDSRGELIVVLNGLDPFAATTSSPGGLAIYPGSPAGTFANPAFVTVGRNPGELSAGDVNGDGRVDLIVQTREGQFSDRLAILINNGAGTFATPRFLATEFGPQRPLLLDINGDSNLDIAIGHCCGDTQLGYYLNGGGGEFSREAFLPYAQSPSALRAGDVDGDGRPDLVAVAGEFGTEKTLRLYRNASPRSGAAAAVSAASFAGDRLAAGSIISIFGVNLASGVVLNSEAVPPEELGGVRVTVRDLLGVERRAQMFFVAPTQVNALIPADTPSGPATIGIRTAGGALLSAETQIVDFAPGLFAATASGLAAANLLRVAGDGTQTVEPVVELNAAGQVVARPIDLGPPDEQVFLLLYGTGIRSRGTPPTNQVTVGGAVQTIQYAGPQGEFVGLDQVNIRLNRTLAGRGLLDVVLSQNSNLRSNAVKIQIR
jgi:uncharacterized protein (TIGR03437 family)